MCVCRSRECGTVNKRILLDRIKFAVVLCGVSLLECSATGCTLLLVLRTFFFLPSIWLSFSYGLIPINHRIYTPFRDIQRGLPLNVIRGVSNNDSWAPGFLNCIRDKIKMNMQFIPSLLELPGPNQGPTGNYCSTRKKWIVTLQNPETR